MVTSYSRSHNQTTLVRLSQYKKPAGSTCLEQEVITLHVGWYMYASNAGGSSVGYTVWRMDLNRREMADAGLVLRSSLNNWREEPVYLQAFCEC